MSEETAVAANGADFNGLREPHVRRVVDAARASHNTSTRRDHAAAWDRFEAWGDREGLGTMPAAPETVAAYLAWRAPVKACLPHRSAWTGQLRIPTDSDHRFRLIPITDSDGFRSVIPIDSDHLGVSE